MVVDLQIAYGPPDVERKYQLSPFVLIPQGGKINNRPE